MTERCDAWFIAEAENNVDVSVPISIHSYPTTQRSILTDIDELVRTGRFARPTVWTPSDAASFDAAQVLECFVKPDIRAGNHCSDTRPSNSLIRFLRRTSLGPLAVPCNANSCTLSSEMLYVTGASFRTLTWKWQLGPGGDKAQPSSCRNRFTASATASYRLFASISTECSIPSISRYVTRQNATK